MGVVHKIERTLEEKSKAVYKLYLSRLSKERRARIVLADSICDRSRAAYDAGNTEESKRLEKEYFKYSSDFIKTDEDWDIFVECCIEVAGIVPNRKFF